MSEEKNIEEVNKTQGASDREEHFPEDSHASQSTDSQQFSVSQSQPQTINDKPETENMEVHKHPHHVTDKKKWGEYFLEFLMIFLAVTLGFFAENIRETI